MVTFLIADARKSPLIPLYERGNYLPLEKGLGGFFNGAQKVFAF